VEFTEAVLIKNPKWAKLVIQELPASGVTVALDDFGTGYTSVGYLRECGFDKIKLDRSLAHAISTNIATQQVVQGTVLVAKSFTADIVAEGVETEEEAKLMRLAGCQQLQGYYFGKPQSVSAIDALLSGNVAKPISYSTCRQGVDTTTARKSLA
jgi:EAL domain-containing protein (putative c-di-GMP-specific phosphodiesterase class I)